MNLTERVANADTATEGMGTSASTGAETYERNPPRRRRNYLYLTLVMAITDFKIKYDHSILGYLWSLLKPLLMFGILRLVSSIFVMWQEEDSRFYLLLGVSDVSS